MVSLAGKSMSKDQYLKLKGAFARCDADRSGSLDVAELATVLKQVGYSMDVASLKTKFKDFDQDGDGKVSFTELMALFHTPPPVAKDKPVVKSGELFTDTSFPPTDDSIFSSPDPAADGVETFKSYAGGGNVKWVRASELCKGGKLFDNVHPNDIAQGGLGDCWLLAALAGIAEFEGSVFNLFEEKKVSPNGMYTVNIFDPVKKSWCPVVIDDYIPTMRNGQPLCAKPQGNEMWVLLLEKAFAKWFGSYCRIQGAYCLVAYMLLMDCESPCAAFSQNVQGKAPWDTESYTALQASMQDAHNRNSVGLSRATRPHSAEQLWRELCDADARNHVMCAWTLKDPETSTGKGASGEHIGADGIVKGHAYSLITAKELQADGKPWRVLQLRNPWGGNPAAEWKGALSDNWSGWRAQPELKKALDIGSAGLDGMFWMAWDDFRRCYSDVGIVPKEMAVPKLGSVESDAGDYAALQKKFGKKFKSAATELASSAQAASAQAAKELSNQLKDLDRDGDGQLSLVEVLGPQPCLKLSIAVAAAAVLVVVLRKL